MSTARRKNRAKALFQWLHELRQWYARTPLIQSLTLTCLIAPFVVMMIVVLAIVLPVVRLCKAIASATGMTRRRRAAWKSMIAARARMSDAAFLAAVSAAPDEAGLWHAVRYAVARECGLPRHTIHPTDSLQSLSDLRCSGDDLLGITFRLEKRLRLKILDQRVLDACSAAHQRGEFKTFAQVAAIYVAAMREARPA